MTREEFLERIDEIMCGTSNAERAYLENLYNEVVAPHWISVEEELPPISGWTTSDDVLAVVKVGSDIGMVVLRYDYEVMAWDNPNEVTHWMPLPQPPKGE